MVVVLGTARHLSAAYLSPSTITSDWAEAHSGSAVLNLESPTGHPVA